MGPRALSGSFTSWARRVAEGAVSEKVAGSSLSVTLANILQIVENNKGLWR